MQVPVYAAALLSVFFQVQKRYKKAYSWPAINTIRKLLAKHHGIHKSNRTIIRWLVDLGEKRLIKRVQRTRRDKVLGTVFQSTLTKITKKGYKVLAKLGVPVWNALKKVFSKKRQAKDVYNVPELTPVPMEDRITLKEIRELRRIGKRGIAPA
ncbi:MAG TPA: hypothetical protein ENI07_04325 [Desulfobacterales bacterium]|nr:hypothetical protein [Desulfobacterales bacterium]